MAPAETPDQAGQELLKLAKERFDDLREAEIKLLRAVPKGDWVVCGRSSDFDDATNDPAKGDEWGPEREVHAKLIRWLCVGHAAAERVDPIGIHLLGARITGILDLSFVSVPFPLRLFRCRLAQEVSLRSAQLPALYLNGSRTGPIRADGLSVRGHISLSEGFTAEGEVRLTGAQIGGGLDCSHGRFKNPPQKGVATSGKALIADGANVKGAVFLSDHFAAEGEVRLLGAEIGNNLECSGGTFNNPSQRNVAASGKALIVDGATVRGSVFLNAGFAAQGEVRLVATEIGRNLICSRGTFENLRQEDVARGGVALNADRLNIKGGVVLSDGFIAEGEVRLPGAQIGGELDCHGGIFKAPLQNGSNQRGTALYADGVSVKDNVFLRDGFTAEGQVRLSGAQIGGQLDCSGGKFKNPSQKDARESGQALNAEGANVKGGVFLRDGFTAKGEVRLLAAQIDADLDCCGGTFSGLIVEGAKIARHLLVALIKDATKGKMNLTNVSTDALLDNEESWPAAGNLYLDGFVYGRITTGPTDAETRLKWLALQPEFKPQPYRQLAKVLREMGDDRGARHVLYEMEKLRRTEQSHIWRDRLHDVKLTWRSRMTGWARYGLALVWGLILKATIGYGFRLQRTLYCILGLTILGAVLFHYGYRAGAMTPTDEKAYSYFQKHREPPPSQQQFMCIIYSLENSVPVFKFGQDSAWTPDPAPRSAAYWWLTWPTFLRLYGRGEIVFGWILATLFVAAVTGVVRRE